MSYKKIVVAYSGGLDTSVMVKWLKEKYDAEIITVTGNLGQKKEIENLEEKAKMTGASQSFIYDLRKEFIEEFAFKALKAGALYEGEYPLATAIGRPLLAKLMVYTANKVGADAIAHGCTGKGNDQVRFEVGIKTLNPDINIIAPLREWEFKTREEELDYAIENKIPISITKESPFSIDENLWGIAVECGALEDTSASPPADAYQITNSPQEAPDKPEIIKLTFENGIPIKLNDLSYDSFEIVDLLNKKGGKHGIGRLDLIENRVVGIKSREIYEAPGALLLLTAHNHLEKLILNKDTFRYKQNISNQIANMIYDGLWYTPLFKALNAFVDVTQENVTGEVVLQLYKGTITVKSRTSPFSLYQKELATYSSGDQFDHSAAEGFIKLYGLSHVTQSKLQKGIIENVVG
jgi:argininosuccinate synthase